MADHFNALNDAFSNDSLIDELGVILSNDPPFVVVMEHKLGISMSIIKPLFLYCKGILDTLGITTDITTIDSNNSNNIACVTRALLVIKGDYPPALAVRKILLEGNYISIDDELKLLSVIFSKHPKSPSAWYHRRWCIEYGIRNHLYSLTPEHMEMECRLCSTNCDIYSRNYYSWNHRLWISSMMSYDQLQQELIFTFEWLHRHTSDHSAIAYRIHIIQMLFENIKHNNSSNKTLVMEFMNKIVVDSMILISSFPGRESLWYHKRGIFDIILNYIRNNFESLWCDGSLKRWNLRDEDYISIQGSGEAIMNEYNEKISMSENNENANSDIDIRSVSENMESIHCLGLKQNEYMGNILTYFTNDHQISCNVDNNSNSNDNRNDIISDCLISWMHLYVKRELWFCILCVNDQDCWLYQQQKKLCINYIAYLLHQIDRFQSDSRELSVSHTSSTLYKMIVINLKQCSAIYDAIQILSDSDSQRCEAKKTVLRRILEVEANL